MNDWEAWLRAGSNLKDVGSLVIAAIGGWYGLRTYRTNAATRRAEFLVDLHRKFFIEDKYRPIRQVLDSEAEQDILELAHFIGEQPEDFIEFLNFFELVAYLWKCKNLAFKDVEALLGYYLRLLIRHKYLREYIRDKTSNGFESLDALLDKIEGAR
jgi:hypothetical protein